MYLFLNIIQPLSCFLHHYCLEKSSVVEMCADKVLTSADKEARACQQKSGRIGSELIVLADINTGIQPHH